MSCASQAAASVCISLEQRVTVSSSSTTIHFESGRAIDRHNPIIHGPRRSISLSECDISEKMQAPSTGAKSTSSNPKTNDQESKVADWTRVRKSSASLVDIVRKSSCIRPSAYLTPPGSQRYLLDDNHKQPHSERVLALVPPEMNKVTTEPNTHGENPVKCASVKNVASLLHPTSDTNSNQVILIVVVRVSLHCKGCAKKLKKHISKMQGVTSFNIDFNAKKVTVVGNVTELDVLASISKVRTAQVLLSPEKTTVATLIPQLPRTSKDIK